jgi:hypothetical protein
MHMHMHMCLYACEWWVHVPSCRDSAEDVGDLNTDQKAKLQKQENARYVSPEPSIARVHNKEKRVSNCCIA